MGFIEAGTVTYDGEAVAACVDGLTNACRNGGSVFAGENSPCERMFVGLLSNGQPCYESNECGGNGRCNRVGTCTSQCCLGVCEEASQPLFSDCTSGYDCDPGLYCVLNPATSLRSCQTGQAGAPCGDSGDCDPVLHCTVEKSEGLGTCVADVQENESCSADTWCPQPLRCVGDDLMTGAGFCKRVDEEGAECDVDEDLSLIHI